MVVIFFPFPIKLLKFRQANDHNNDNYFQIEERREGDGNASIEVYVGAPANVLF